MNSLPALPTYSGSLNANKYKSNAVLTETKVGEIEQRGSVKQQIQLNEHVLTDNVDKDNQIEFYAPKR